MNNFDLDYYSKLSLPLFAFYMLMFGNFTNRLLGDKLFYYIQNNTLIKHSIGFVNLLFFIILANESKLDDGIVEILLYAVSVYILVIFTLQLHPILIFTIILLLLIIYILNIIIKIRNRKNPPENTHDLNTIKNALAFLTVSIIIIGYIIFIFTPLKI